MKCACALFIVPNILPLDLSASMENPLRLVAPLRPVVSAFLASPFLPDSSHLLLPAGLSLPAPSLSYLLVFLVLSHLSLNRHSNNGLVLPMHTLFHLHTLRLCYTITPSISSPDFPIVSLPLSIFLPSFSRL